MITTDADGPGLAQQLGALAAWADANPTSARTCMDGALVRFENASYAITVAEGGTVRVSVLQSGVQYLAWDPATIGKAPAGGVAGAGDGADPEAPAFTFWGDTTLTLEDGTKVTIHTAPGQDATVRLTRPDQVVITSGGYGVQVHGLDRGGDALGFVETSVLGWLLDAVVPDGAVLREDAATGTLVGDDPGGLWTTVRPDEIAPPLLAALGPLAIAVAAAGASGATMQLAEGVIDISFMGSFRGAPTFELYGGEDLGAPAADPNRLADLEGALCRLMLARDGHHHVRWAAAGRGWGAP